MAILPSNVILDITVLEKHIDEIVEKFQEYGKKIEQRNAVALKIYLAGKWSRDPRSYFEDAALWEEFRVAFDIPKGTATEAGVAG